MAAADDPCSKRLCPATAARIFTRATTPVPTITILRHKEYSLGESLVAINAQVSGARLFNCRS